MNTEQQPSTPPTRYALVQGAPEVVSDYLPGNYRILKAVESECVLVGEDSAGWTLDGYVLPRLATSFHAGAEIDKATAQCWAGELYTADTADPVGGSCRYCGSRGRKNLYVDRFRDREAECRCCGANWPIGPAPDPGDDNVEDDEEPLW